MFISSIAHSMPELEVSNQDFLEKFDQLNRPIHGNKTDELLDKIKENFEKSGSQTRRYLEADEPWFPHAKRSIESAAAEAETPLNKIDCIIYSSVFRTVLEPSMASLIAKAMGMRYAQCFDINEACSSWVRALSLSKALLDSGRYQRILIVTAEANGRWGAFGTKPLTNPLSKAEDLQWSFATMTVGSAFSATIVQADENTNDWSITHGSDNSLAEHSIFPLDFPSDIEHDLGSDGIGVTNSKGAGPGFFTCLSEDLQIGAAIPFARFVFKEADNARAADVVVPHAQTYYPYLEIMDFLGTERDKLHSIYPKFGNLVTSSLPVGIADGVAQEKIKRGDKVFLLVPASGLSMATCTFTY